MTLLGNWDVEPPSGLTGPVRWYGGKASIVGWLSSLTPHSARYVEPYGGAASLLFSRRPSSIEVYNDLHDDLVNLMRCLQHPARYAKLERRASLTLYARSEYLLAIDTLAHNTDPDERAWAFFVAVNQATNGSRPTPGRWARTTEPSGGVAKTALRWQSRLGRLTDYHDRLRGVQIEHADALDVIAKWDSKDTVFYLDPPYIARQRVAASDYLHEATPDHHEQLVSLLLHTKGQVVLSGYADPIYEALEEAGWEVQVKKRSASAGVASGGRPIRTETVWISPAAQLGRADA